MKQTVVIIHSHLNPGGVTRIIESLVKALLPYREALSIKILTGQIPDGYGGIPAEIPVVVHPDLDYLLNNPDYPDKVDRIYNAITTVLKEHIDPGDIIHAHNSNLGKNPLLTHIIYKFAKEGNPLVHHCHDFAEDRPENYQFLGDVIEAKLNNNLCDVLYPDLRNVRYAVINSSDRNRLHRLGILPDRVVLLPNPVDLSHRDEQAMDVPSQRRELCDQLGLDSEKLIITYPVRVIRRKNIGEFILLAALFEDEANWLVTLPPKNPIETKDYEKWKKFCRKHRIKVHFDVGTRCDFVPLITASDLCITTSRMEGFGMTYLEPWLMHTPVVGRNIPMVTADLYRTGLTFPALYDQVRVEIKSIQCDFKDLVPKDQKKIIKKLLKDKHKRKEFREANPLLQAMLTPVPASIIQENIDVIRKNYSLSNYGKRLNDIYTEIAESAAAMQPNPDRPE